MVKKSSQKKNRHAPLDDVNKPSRRNTLISIAMLIVALVCVGLGGFVLGHLAGSSAAHDAQTNNSTAE